MSKPRPKGPCFRCGASLALSNCPDTGQGFCPDCGQCECLRRYDEDYKPETDWMNG